MSMMRKKIEDNLEKWEAGTIGDDWIFGLSDDDLRAAWWLYSLSLYRRYGRFYHALEAEFDARCLVSPSPLCA